MKRICHGHTCLNFFTHQKFNEFRRVNRNFDGYTIIEAMIVLAISGAILSAAMLTFRGQQGRTEFTQSMRDIDSKIQTIAKDVASGISSNTMACTIDASSGRPNLSSVTPGSTGTNPECIFLGKAIEVNTNSDTIKTYTVLGKRNSSMTLSAANPTAVGSPESYSLIGGSTIKSSTTYDFSGSTHQDSGLVGIYLGMNSSTDSSDRGSAGGPLLIRGYKSSSSGACVEGGCVGVIPQVSKWKICFQSAYSSSKAELTITPSSSGLTTQLNFDGCTAP